MKNNQQGAVIVEATWCILLALFVCLFFISYGFAMYQHAMVGIVANDIAEEVAQTYKLRYVDDTAAVSEEDVAGVGKYRYLFFSKSFDSENDSKAKDLASDRLSSTSLAKSRDALSVSVDKITDDLGRYHLQVTVKQRYQFLFGDLLSLLGTADLEMIESTVNVAGTDVSYYANMIRTTSYVMDSLGENGAIKFLDSGFKFLGTLFNIGC